MDGAGERATPLSARPRSKRWLLLVAGYAALLGASHGVRLHRAADCARPAVPAGVHAARLSVPGDAGDLIRVAYRDLGPRGAPVLLLLHGSPGRKENFAGLAEPLAERFRVIIPDLPGFGASQRDVDDVSILAHGRALGALLETLGVERVHVVGFSMGGGPALHLADLAPDRVASLTLLSSIGVQELELLGDYTLNRLLHGIQWVGIALLTYGVPHFGGLDAFPLNLAYANNFLQSDQRPLRAILASYGAPALVLHSESDRLVAAAAAREHHRLLPQSDLVWIDGGHFALFRRGPAIATEIARFVDRVESGTALRRAQAPADRVAAAALPFRPEGPVTRGVLATLAFFALVWAASMLSEDLTCIGVGLLVARGQVDFGTGVAAAVFALWSGDLLLFGAGRLAARRLRAESRWPRLHDRLRQSGSVAIFASRFVPGSRLPLYLAAGGLGFPALRFAAVLLVAALVWTPVVVGVSARVGAAAAQQLDEWRWGALAVVLGLWLALRWTPQLVTFRGRRMLWGRLRRLTNWEFWPWWILYQPVWLRVAALLLRHRSARLVTAANPGILGGGLVGESKWKIVAPLQDRVPDRIASTAFLPARERPAARRARVESFMTRRDLDYPIVIKPDEGERGFGVTIVRRAGELDGALAAMRREALAQEYVPGAEFGVFYVRFPDRDAGELFSITEKCPLQVAGDGVRTLERLILDDPRAQYLAALHLEQNADRAHWVPAAGEVVALTELGTHSRGALFFDGGHLETTALRSAVDRVARALPGFYFGRFDLRAPDRGALQRGEFKIVELNGVTAEATHIYDPRYRVGDAVRVLCRQWELAVEVAAANRRAGAPLTPYRTLADLVWHRLGR